MDWLPPHRSDDLLGFTLERPLRNYLAIAQNLYAMA
jgi:hypothetical protein